MEGKKWSYSALTECVPPVEVGFFPLDEELGLHAHSISFTPRLHEWLVRLGTWVPFAQAATLLEDFAHVRVSRSTARRLTEMAGAEYERVQTEEVERIEKLLPPSPQGPAKGLLSVDGAMVPLRGGEWAEVKTMVLGEVDAAGQCGQLSYFSRMTDADTFGRLALVETQRRGLERAERVGAVMDGAEWQQGFVDYHRPDAVRVLDFPHAAERLSGIGNIVWGEGTPTNKQWLSTQCHQLKHEGPAKVLAELRLLREAHPNIEVLATNLAYLEKREEQMQYPHFQEEGWPIGSGVVESANKLVVEARLKGAGMHWERGAVNPMLTLRNVVCNDRWREAWPQMVDRAHQQRRQSKQASQQVRESSTDTMVRRAKQARQVERRQVDVLCITHPTKAKRTEPWRPAPNHPWRRYKTPLPMQHAKL